MDYQSNSKRSKEEKVKPEKKIERVISSDVIVKKKSPGRKFRELFIEADFKSVVHYVIYEVVIPAARNTFFDASTKGIERMLFGEAAARRRGYGYGIAPRVTYNSPVNRGYRESVLPVPRPGLVSIPARSNRNDFVLPSREDAALILERMTDIIDTYDVVSVADLNDLVGLSSSHVDNKWGWIDVNDAQIRQVREGFLLDLPQPEPIQ